MPYAVIARCAQAGLTLAQVLTTTVSHELFEAATDPLPGANSAYTGVDDDHLVYGVAQPGPRSATCATSSRGANYTPTGYAFMVERMWSNAAAASGRDPCQPELPGEIVRPGDPAALRPGRVPLRRARAASRAAC